MQQATGRRIGFMRLAFAGMIASIALSACAQRDNERILFDGIYFRSKAKSVNQDRQSFAVTVPKANRSINGAREAGRYEGTLYCIQNFGTSDINWINGPDAEDGRLQLEGNALKLNGRCTLW